MTSDETAILQLFKRTLALKELPRTGAIIEGVTRSEADTIASHSHSVSVLSYLVALHLAGEFEDVIPDRVSTMAVLHDLAECVTGDLPTGFKRLVPEAAARVESQAFAFLFDGLSAKSALLAIVDEYERGRSAAAKIVKFADIVDAYVHLKMRLGKEFGIYLERAGERLRRDSPDADAGVGNRLAEWLEAIREEWDQISAKPFPKAAPNNALEPSAPN
jgi:5'-deoxynucleotidase YfbR-like HD superfamily hydrolase